MGVILLFWQELESRGGFTLLQHCLMSLCTEYGDEFLERMHTAQFRAFEDPALNSAHQALFIKKIVGTDINSYQIISEIENHATKFRLSYPAIVS